MIISNHKKFCISRNFEFQFPMATFSEQEIQNFFTEHGASAKTSEDFTEMFHALEELIKTRHGVKARRVVDSAERCYARSWSGGKGGQCGSKRVDGSDYCKRCAKKADETCVPCSFTEDGKKTGLHFGDIREEVPFLSPSGTVAIVWNESEVRAKIIAAMEDGATYHKFSSEGKKGKTSPPRIAGQKKKVTKDKKKTSSRGKNAFLFFLGDGNRAKFKEVLIAFYKHTGKHPNATLSFLVENDLDLAAAKSDFDAKVGGDEWNAMIESASWENDADFSKELKGTLITGPTSKLGGLVWNSLSDEKKAPYQKMAKDEKAKKIAAMENMDDSASDSDDEKMVKKVVKKTKKTKKERRALAAQKAAALAAAAAAAALAAEDAESSDEDSGDELDVEEINLADGTTVLKDDDGMCYNPATSEELGTWDEETNSIA